MRILFNNLLKRKPKSTMRPVALLMMMLLTSLSFAQEPAIQFKIVNSIYAYQGYESSAELKALIDSSEQICLTSLTSTQWFGRSTCSITTTNNGYYLKVNFNAVSAGDWEFRLGPDFGRGGVMFLDGQVVASVVDDLWWGYSWNSIHELIQSGPQSLSAGAHTLEIFGFENCCGGLMTLQYKEPGAQWNNITTDNIAGYPDGDGDYISDNDDNCPTQYNPNQEDSDYDGIGDVCDTCPNDENNDSDGDDICGDLDNCPFDANPDQQDLDGDGIGDLCDDDIDGDGILNDQDNCPYAYNADQADFDGDGVGDVCDMDADGDGVLDVDDACLSTPLGEIVDEYGCSIWQNCPCDNNWKNHGAYIKCVVTSVRDFIEKGLLVEEDTGPIVSDAAQTDCGKKK